MKKILILAKNPSFIPLAVEALKGLDYKIITNSFESLQLGEDAEVALDVAYAVRLYSTVNQAKAFIDRKKEIAVGMYVFVIVDEDFMNDMNRFGNQKFETFRKESKNLGVKEFFTVRADEMDIVRSDIEKLYIPVEDEISF